MIAAGFCSALRWHWTASYWLAPRVSILSNLHVLLHFIVTTHWRSTPSPVFASVRVYALFHRKWWAFTVVLVTALINPVILFVSGACSLPHLQQPTINDLQYLFTRSVPSIGTVEGFSSCTLALAGSTDSYETYVLASLRYRYALTP